MTEYCFLIQYSKQFDLKIWIVSLEFLSFTVISVPKKSEKRNKKTNKFRKDFGFKIFKNWHLLFTFKVGC